MEDTEMNELSTVKTAPLQQEQKQTKTGKPYMKADNCTMTDVRTALGCLS